ncbi:CBS domain-containing protein [Rhodoferax saidenbachensis]|uniref:CBS domain-containing protein n=1 Tax=Rhodoferax saidenbachensis TaxID=1484693 RepID=A0A1P8K7E9_9BURK|nr:CBS domain-containing protein [Rhodoferax saidenbachensis]APW41871.1 CBS domain-containing protein [Rhodoferax saidenbachensis]
MFSVYGTAGRMFRGSLEELRKVGPASALMRTQRVGAAGQDGQERPPSQFSDLLPDPPTPVDVVHRSAVAAYAQTTKPDGPRQPLTRVDAIMSTAVVTIADTSTVEEAWALLARHGMGQAPVVTEAGVLVGLLSRADLMRPDRLPGPESHALVWRALLAQSVVEVMWTPVPSVAPDTDIRRLARVLLDTGLPGLPVVDEGGQVIGFVSRSDILRAVVADPPLDLWT